MELLFVYHAEVIVAGLLFGFLFVQFFKSKILNSFGLIILLFTIPFMGYVMMNINSWNSQDKILVPKILPQCVRIYFFAKYDKDDYIDLVINNNVKSFQKEIEMILPICDNKIIDIN